MKKPSILTLQQQFSDFLKRGSLDSSHEIEQTILNQLPISIQERLAIYKNAYKLRIHGSLKEDFPKTYEALSSRKFFGLVEEYMLKFPSTYWSLSEFSKNLPEFIATSNWGREYQFLAELAQFEWLKNLSFLSEKLPQFDFSSLLKIPDNKHNDVILKLDPTVFLFKARWAVHYAGVKKFIPKRSNFYIIYKDNNTVCYENIPKYLWEILNHISQGFKIGDILESSVLIEEKKIYKFFSKWVTKGIISHFIYDGAYQK